MFSFYPWKEVSSKSIRTYTKITLNFILFYFLDTPDDAFYG